MFLFQHDGKKGQLNKCDRIGFRESISNRWNFFNGIVEIPKEAFLQVVRLVLNSTYFSFDGFFYKRKFGTSVVSLFSPIIANLVMQDLQTKALSKIPRYHFILDIVMTIPSH